MIGGLVIRSLDRGAVIFLVLLAAIAILVPVLNLALPPYSPFHVSSYFVALFGKYLCYALLALSIDLIWGYCGILSLGHGAFFALGGYAMGMYLMRQIGTRGVYAHPVLPDFMVFLNWPELPVYWYGFQHFPYALLMVVLVPGALAFVFGWFAFRSRVTGVYLSIITQALTFALMLGFFRNNFGFGGNNGLTDFKDILGFNVQAPGTRAALFAGSLSRWGSASSSAASSSPRSSARCWSRSATPKRAPASSATGSRPTSSCVHASACMAGLLARSTCRRSASSIRANSRPANSIEAVIWVAVGGRGTLTGAVIGACWSTAARPGSPAAFPHYWLFVLGGLFIAVTLLLPTGIMGPSGPVARQWQARERQASIKAEEGIDTDDAPPKIVRGGSGEWSARSKQRPRAAAGQVVDVEIRHHPLSRRRLALLRRLQGDQQSVAGARPWRDAHPSAPTAPARPP